MSRTASRLLRVAALAALLVGAVAIAPSSSRAQPAELAPDTLALDDLSAFRSPAGNWQVAGGVFASRHERRHLRADSSGTGILVNQPTERARENLFTRWEHGDLALEMDVMVPKGSNSGVYLMGRYEIQILDSWGVESPTFSDLGGVYERWDGRAPEGERGYQGQPPRVNVARAPGLWQHLRIEFRAPRFEGGRKVENAEFEKVVLNGVVIHRNVEVTGPTRGAAFVGEQRSAPLMLQGDHGPVAFRNVRYRRLDVERVRVENVRYSYYEGDFQTMPVLDTLTARRDSLAGPLSQTVAERAAGFALRFDGRLRVPRSGPYRFDLRARNGGGRFSVDGQRVATGDSTGAVVRLDAGTHPFTLRYFKNPQSWSSPGLALFAEGPAMPRHELTQPASFVAFEEQVSPIYVEAEERAVVLRSFLRHGDRKRTRVASVGHPGQIHYALDMGQAAPLYLWKGPFADATPMWHARGETQTIRMRGSPVALAGTPSVARLPDENAPWPDSLPSSAAALNPASTTFAPRGYQLGEQGRPTFRYRLGDVQVTDRFVPGPENRLLTREVTFHSASEGRSVQEDGGRLWLRVATAEQIRRLPDGSFSVGDYTYYVDLDETNGAEPRVRRTRDGRRQLLLPVPTGDRSPEGATRLRYDLIW